MDKTTILRAFNTHFFEFLDDVISIYPENIDIQAGKNTFLNIKKINPTTIIKCWHNFISIPYSKAIENKDFSFFIEKNYQIDLALLKNQKEILNIIEKLKIILSKIDENNKDHILNYLNNLNKLSFAYSSSSSSSSSAYAYAS